MPDNDALYSATDYPEVWPDAVGADVDITGTYGQFTRTIRVGSGGTLVTKNSNGVERIVHLVNDGEWLCIRCSKILAKSAAGEASTCFAISLIL